jgi:hypothetical protein
MAAEKLRYSEERAIPLPPEELKRLAQRLGMVPSIDEGINVELEFVSDFLLTENRVLQQKLAKKEEEVGTLRGQISSRDGEIQQKDQRIAQLEQEIENLRSSQPALPPAASEKPALPEEGAKKENQPSPKNSWMKKIFGRLFDRKPTTNETIRSRSELILYLDRLRQTPKGSTIAREITQIIVEEEEKRANLQERARNLRRRVAHGISTFLVLGSLLAGSKVPFSPSAKEKEEELTRTPISQIFYCAPESTSRVEIGELGTPPPAAESHQPRREKIAPKSSIEVVISEGSWFLQAADPQVADWLLANHYVNWQNEENNVWKSEVIAKILADELEAQGVDPQHVLPGQRFAFDLGNNEEVVKVAKTRSFQEYYQ